MAGSNTGVECDGHGSASLKLVNGILIVRNSETILKQVENLLVDHEGKLPYDPLRTTRADEYF